MRRDSDKLLASITLEDAAPLFLEYQKAGAELIQPLRTEPWGARTFVVRDPDGNYLVVDVVEGPDDPVAGAVDAMITVRSGGSVLDSSDATALLSSTGFVAVAEVNRTWQAPLRLVSGRSLPATDTPSNQRVILTAP